MVCERNKKKKRRAKDRSLRPHDSSSRVFVGIPMLYLNSLSKKKKKEKDTEKTKRKKKEDSVVSPALTSFSEKKR